MTLSQPYKELYEELTLTVITGRFGDKFWYNSENQLHRSSGPAIEYIDGSKSWYQNGLRHRENGPAIELNTGLKEWYQNGQLHREDGPAIEHEDGTREYWLNGVFKKIKTRSLFIPQSFTLIFEERFI